MRGFDEVDRLTMAEYRLHVKAIAEKREEKERDLHLVAWLSVAARATKKNGSLVYDKFEKFYKENKEVKISESKISRIRKYYEESKNNG